MRKSFFLAFFFFPLYFPEPNIALGFTSQNQYARHKGVSTQLRLGDDPKPIDITRFHQVIGRLYYFFDLSRYFLHSHQVVLVHVVNLSASKS